MPEKPGAGSSGAEKLINEALTLHQQGQLKQAEAHYRKALALAPDNPDILHRLGLLLLHAKRPADASVALARALAIDAAAPQTWLLQGMALAALKNHPEALASCSRALELQPDNPPALNLAANLEQQRGNAPAAKALLEHALRLRPDFSDAHHNMGITLASLGETDVALEHYAQALALTPGNAQIHCNRGLLLLQVGRTAEASEAFKAALELKPKHLPARLEHIYAKLLLCEWDGLEDERTLLARGLRNLLEAPAASVVSPYILNLALLPADLIRAVTERYAAEVGARAGKLNVTVHGKRPAHDRLRIAYLSPDFGAHAVGGLVYRLFQHHNRERFHVSAFSLRHFDDWFSRAIQSGCDRFHDLSAMPLQAAAEAIASERPDILVDLGGYTAGTRPELVAARLAPVQLSWLGYLNSAGGDFIDYLVADAQLVPPGNDTWFSEAIARLPGTFLPASPLPVADYLPGRAELGLPADGFVFCSFNNTYKIQRDTFSAWMRILGATPGSVLWLYAGREARARHNLRRYASELAIDPARLVFADGLPMDAHMARMPCADLFLDTFHYNAGATAVGTLLAGVPLLTLRGQYMLGRMGASLNAAAGLGELICNSPEEYIARAVALASDSAHLPELRTRLATVIAADNTFNIGKFAARLEQLFEVAWARHAAGKKPRSFEL